VQAALYPKSSPFGLCHDNSITSRLGITRTPIILTFTIFRTDSIATARTTTSIVASSFTIFYYLSAYNVRQPKVSLKFSSFIISVCVCDVSREYGSGEKHKAWSLAITFVYIVMNNTWTNTIRGRALRNGKIFEYKLQTLAVNDTDAANLFNYSVHPVALTVTKRVLPEDYAEPQQQKALLLPLSLL
jgi:hypothetical protein